LYLNPGGGGGGFSPGLICKQATFKSSPVGGINGGILGLPVGGSGIIVGGAGGFRLGTMMGSPPGTNSPHPKRMPVITAR
tara:strand:- start:231 stop:470 length:240 start_codon:yes stop_codon:yes gene_type:complete